MLNYHANSDRERKKEEERLEKERMRRLMVRNYVIKYFFWPIYTSQALYDWCTKMTPGISIPNHQFVPSFEMCYLYVLYVLSLSVIFIRVHTPGYESYKVVPYR